MTGVMVAASARRVCCARRAGTNTRRAKLHKRRFSSDAFSSLKPAVHFDPYRPRDCARFPGRLVYLQRGLLGTRRRRAINTSKPAKTLPPAGARGFVESMRDFYAEEDATSLGPVEIQDSQIGMSVIQAPKGVWHAPIRFDKRPVGEDGAALFG
jgi:hypothetical protein